MQGLAELNRTSDADATSLRGEFGQVVASTCRNILVFAARRSPLEGDIYAEGYVRGVFETLKYEESRHAARYGGLLLVQVKQDGVGYVRKIARQLFDDAEYNDINLGMT